MIDRVKAAERRRHRSTITISVHLPTVHSMSDIWQLQLSTSVVSMYHVWQSARQTAPAAGPSQTQSHCQQRHAVGSGYIHQGSQNTPSGESTVCYEGQASVSRLWTQPIRTASVNSRDMMAFVGWTLHYYNKPCNTMRCLMKPSLQHTSLQTNFSKKYSIIRIILTSCSTDSGGSRGMRPQLGQKFFERLYFGINLW